MLNGGTLSLDSSDMYYYNGASFLWQKKEVPIGTFTLIQINSNNNPKGKGTN